MGRSLELLITTALCINNIVFTENNIDEIVDLDFQGFQYKVGPYQL